MPDSESSRSFKAADCGTSHGAERFLEMTLHDLGTSDMPGDGSYTYDDSVGDAERFMLAGGNPSAWAVFVRFASDYVTGYIEYTDSTGTAIVRIPDQLVNELHKAMRRDANARNART